MIEPHLGFLHHVLASLPTPRGPIEVNYSSSGLSVNAEINLPGNVNGELVWKGKTFNLHPGRQQLLLP